MVWAAGAFVLLYAALMAASYLDPGFAGDDVGRGVELGGASIAGLDDDELRAAVAEQAAAYADTEVVIDTGEGTVTTTAADLGLALDVDETTEAVEDGDPFVLLRPVAWVGSFFREREAERHFGIEEGQLLVALSELELPGITEAREPTLEGGADGVRAVPGTPGAGVDTDDLEAALRGAADDDADGSIEVETQLVDVAPVATDAEADAAAADAEDATATPLTVTVGGVERPLDVAAVRSWLALTVDGPGEVGWTLDESIALPALAELFADAGSPGTPASFWVENGVVSIVGGDDPTACCDPTSVERIDDALHARTTQVALDLTVAEGERDREWAESLGIVEEVASFTTTHACCQNRVTNIHLIADATRGVVIEPGATFSLNGHVGQRTAEKGYVAAGGITNGVLVDQLGGGISQYTTGLFNAAFFAGLDFGEYQAHSIYFSRYPYGREATLSWPHPDLQIVNTTPYGILIWPSYTDTSITVTLYSTRYVDVEQTGQTTSPQGVCTRVRTERTRTYLDGRVEVDTVGALYRRREGENCSGESSVPTTTTTPPAAPPPTEPVAPPPEPPPADAPPSGG